MPITDKKYVSAIPNLDTRVIRKQILDVQNTIGLTDVMNLLGRYEEVDQASFSSYVNKSLWPPVTSQGTVTGSGTATVVLTATAGTSGNARLNDHVRFEDGSVGFISALTPGTNDAITVTSLDGSNLTHTTGQKMYFYSNAIGEGGTSRSNKQTGLTRYEQKIQIFAETDEQTDIAKMSKVEVEVDGKPYYFVKERIEKFMKFKAEVNAAAIQSKISASSFTTSTSALTDPQGGGIIQSQRGIDQYVKSFGFGRNVDALGTFDADDLGKLVDLAIANKAELNFFTIAAAPVARMWDDYWKGVGSSGIASAQLNVNGKEFDFTVEKLTYSGATFQRMDLPIINHPEITAPDIKKNMYFLNAGKTKVFDSKGNAVYGDRIRQRYMAHPFNGPNNQGTKIWAEFHHGGASDVTPTNGTAKSIMELRTYQAIEMLGAEHSGYMKFIS